MEEKILEDLKDLNLKEQKQETEGTKDVKFESKNQQNSEKEILNTDFLVIDTGAFINGVQVDKYSKELFTIPEVINEVRDKFARDFLTKFPWEIKIREPSGEAIQHGLKKKFLIIH